VKKTASLLALILIFGISPAQSRAEETATGQTGTQTAAEEAAKEGTEAQASAEETAAKETTTEETEDQTFEADVPPPFTLITEDDDGPGVARLKAALRLLKHAKVTTNALQACPGTPGTVKALRDFQGRNGNTLPILMNVIKESGGLTPQVRALIDKEVNEETVALLEETGCQALTDQVAKNSRDIYKAPELAADYKLVREKPSKKR
jgi:hypothetical protein